MTVCSEKSTVLSDTMIGLITLQVNIMWKTRSYLSLNSYNGYILDQISVDYITCTPAWGSFDESWNCCFKCFKFQLVKISNWKSCVLFHFNSYPKMGRIKERWRKSTYAQFWNFPGARQERVEVIYWGGGGKKWCVQKFAIFCHFNAEMFKFGVISSHLTLCGR